MYDVHIVYREAGKIHTGISDGHSSVADAHAFVDMVYKDVEILSRSVFDPAHATHEFHMALTDLGMHFRDQDRLKELNMDPNATCTLVLDMIDGGDFEGAKDAMADLDRWVARGGFEPDEYELARDAIRNV